MPERLKLSCYSYLLLSGGAPEDALSIISLSAFDIVVLLVSPSADRAVVGQNSLLIDSVFQLCAHWTGYYSGNTVFLYSGVACTV
jgi:hypothetical protein